MVYEFTEKFRIARFRKHYSSLYPTEMNSACKAFIKGLVNLDLTKPVLIMNRNDYMRQSFIAMFMKKGFVDYKFMSAYSLLDIYLGNSEDVKTVLDITSTVVCVYLGYGEFENKRQVDVLIQLINNQVLLGKTVWVYCRADESHVDTKWPGLTSYFKVNKYNIVGSGSSTPQTRVRTLSEEL